MGDRLNDTQQVMKNSEAPSRSELDMTFTNMECEAERGSVWKEGNRAWTRTLVPAGTLLALAAQTFLRPQTPKKDRDQQSPWEGGEG